MCALMTMPKHIMKRLALQAQVEMCLCLVRCILQVHSERMSKFEDEKTKPLFSRQREKGGFLEFIEVY